MTVPYLRRQRAVGRCDALGRGGTWSLTNEPSVLGKSNGHQVVSSVAAPDYSVSHAKRDSLSREVYCVLGIPLDVIDIAGVVSQIESAANDLDPFLFSTPNLNFLVTSCADAEFRESLLISDLCPADGMPVVWLARFLGVPVRERVAGSDIFEALKARHAHARRLKTFLFGGADGVAAAASASINAAGSSLACVGFLNPGHGNVDTMSRQDTIEEVNASNADFLAVSLGATKGQAWLYKNHRRLRIPIRAHLGATINFQAGTTKRAPHAFRKLGLEWAWRIKEEPFLWQRYWCDGWTLLRLIVTNVVPAVFLSSVSRWVRRQDDLQLHRTDNDSAIVLHLAGAASAKTVDKAVSYFRDAIAARPSVLLVDLSDLRFIDPRFLGLLLMVRKQLREQASILRFTRASKAIERLFRLHGVDFLLSDDDVHHVASRRH